MRKLILFCLCLSASAQTVSKHDFGAYDTTNPWTGLNSYSLPVKLIPITYANLILLTPSDGQVIVCSDCTSANPTAAGGSGGLVFYLNGQWGAVVGSSSGVTSVSGDSNCITVANGTTTAAISTLSPCKLTGSIAIPSNGSTFGIGASAVPDTCLGRDSANVWNLGNCSGSDKSGTAQMQTLILSGPKAGSFTWQVGNATVPTIGAGKVIAAYKNNELEVSNNGDAYSQVLRASDGPSQNISARCGGVATSSVTIILFPGASGTGYSCISTGAAEVPITYPGTFKNLRCRSSAGGVNGSSGITTLYVNNATTALTATFGTGTSINDATHSVTVADGDRYSIRFTTQALETLADVVCSVRFQQFQ